jgi:hypothetical protein
MHGRTRNDGRLSASEIAANPISLDSKWDHQEKSYDEKQHQTGFLKGSCPT